MSPVRLKLDMPVCCHDGEVGSLADTVIDPLNNRVTHVVVALEDDHSPARLVPIQRVRRDSAGAETLYLECARRELESCDAIHESSHHRIDDPVVADPDWDIGISSAPVLSSVDGLAAAGLGLTFVPPELVDHVTTEYDRVPKRQVEIRRASSVFSKDGHRLGQVDGFIVDDGDLISHLILEKRHLWHTSEAAIPLSAVATVTNDEVHLTLSGAEVDEVAALGARPPT